MAARLSAICLCLIIFIASMTMAAGPVSTSAVGYGFHPYIDDWTQLCCTTDSAWTCNGATATKTVLSLFKPAWGWEYVLCRDTISSAKNRDSCKSTWYLKAYDKDTLLVGKAKFDSLWQSEGSSPDQYVIPFGTSLIGKFYSVTLENSTAKDSITFNRVEIKRRKWTSSPNDYPFDKSTRY